ncbi:heparinase II/III family protein [Arthrobacter sp. D1-29]
MPTHVSASQPDADEQVGRGQLKTRHPKNISARGTFQGPLAAAWGTEATQDALLRTLRGGRERLANREAEGQKTWPTGTALAGLQGEAEAERSAPWPQPLLSHYARYFRDGNRTAYEDLVAARQQRLTRAVVMACLSRRVEQGAEPGDGPSTEKPGEPDSVAAFNEWLDDVIDGAYLLCEQSSWCWAAHEDAYHRLGHVVPERSEPYLDLGAGEVAAQLAWLDLLLGDQLDQRAPGLRRRIRGEVLDRVVRPFLNRHDWHWLGLDGDVHNWNPWIHSNVIAAAVVLVDDPGLQAKTIALAIEGLDRFLASMPADGAVDEGFSYWWNGAGRALEALAVLEDATAGRLDGNIPVVRELVAFPHRMHLGHDWYLNVADGPAKGGTDLPWDLVRRWGERLGDHNAARHATAQRTQHSTAPQPDVLDVRRGLGRTLRALADAGQRKGTGGEGIPEPPAPPLIGFTYLESVQIMLARENPGRTDGLVLAAKGGHNGEHHNHRDVGSVVVAVDGVPLLVDAGQPTYTAQTFGPDRYAIRAMQSAWHNVPAPFGLEQGTGRKFAAAVQEAPTPEKPRLVLGLGEAYGLGPANRWVRSASLVRASSPPNPAGNGASERRKARVLIEDRWNLPSPNPAVSRTPEAPSGTPDVDIHYLLSGTVTMGPVGTATIRPSRIPGGVPGRTLERTPRGMATIRPREIPDGVPGRVPGGTSIATPGGISHLIPNEDRRGGLLRWEPAAAVVLVDEWLLDDPLLANIWGSKLTRLRFRMPAHMRAAGAFTLTVEANDES